MKGTDSKRLTPLETLVMRVVWDRSRATVREVREALAPRKPLAYNSVLTVMRILRDKGFLTSEREGRVDVYSAAVSRREVAKHSLNTLLRHLFGGSPRALVSELLESDDITLEEVRAIRAELDERFRERREGGEGPCSDSQVS